MNEQLVKILEKAYETSVKTGEFIVEEGGILIEQFLRWKVWEHSILILIGLLLFIAYPIIFRRLANESDNSYDTIEFLGKRVNEDLGLVGYISSVILFIIGVLVFTANTLHLVKLIIAPNVYLLEYILDKI